MSQTMLLFISAHIDSTLAQCKSTNSKLAVAESREVTREREKQESDGFRLAVVRSKTPAKATADGTIFSPCPALCKGAGFHHLVGRRNTYASGFSWLAGYGLRWDSPGWSSWGSHNLPIASIKPDSSRYSNPGGEHAPKFSLSLFWKGHVPPQIRFRAWATWSPFFKLWKQYSKVF
jgi:hypothetical protein